MMVCMSEYGGFDLISKEGITNCMIQELRYLERWEEGGVYLYKDMSAADARKYSQARKLYPQEYIQ